MNDDFTSCLQEHFDKHDEASANKVKHSQESNAKLQESRDKFVTVAKSTIEPTLNKACEFLLKRNFPAAVVYPSHDERVEKTDGYIALNCSKDIKDFGAIETRALFRIKFAFTAYDEKVAIRTEGLSPKGFAYDLKLSEVTQLKVEKFVSDFLQACFPSE
jgi:hypothetical protein